MTARKFPPTAHVAPEDDPMARWNLIEDVPPPVETTVQLWDGETADVYVGRFDRRGALTIMNVPGPWPVMLYWASLEEP